MTYIELINEFWEMDATHHFTANETRLYFYLLDSCNKLRWKNPFYHSNEYLIVATGIAKASFRLARNKLIESGLIDCRTGNGRKNNTLYYIKGIENNTLSTEDTEKGVGIDTFSNKKGTEIDTLLGKGTKKGSRKGTGKGIEIDPQHKTKTKDKDNREVLNKFNTRKNFQFSPAELTDRDCKNVLSLWNSICTSYQSVVKLSKKGTRTNRKRVIQMRLAEMQELTATGSKEEIFQILKIVFEKTQASNFLKGDGLPRPDDSSAPGATFKANFDWVLGRSQKGNSNWQKIYEGNYDNAL